MVSGLRGVVKIAAGLRHSFAVVEKGTSELWAWGYNGYGELGLGDCDMRIQPTKLTAFRDTTVVDISCGDRHTVVITSHKPMKIRESPLLRPFFSILQVRSCAIIIIVYIQPIMSVDSSRSVNSAFAIDILHYYQS
jgi:hypothetical protein